MANLSSQKSDPWSTDTEIWSSLKRAIAASSGFQRWQLEQRLAEQLHGMSLDQQVSGYLRDTLETLAY